MSDLGATYAVGGEDVEQSRSEAFRWFTAASEAGSALAMNLAGCYREGNGCAKDEARRHAPPRGRGGRGDPAARWRSSARSTPTARAGWRGSRRGGGCSRARRPGSVSARIGAACASPRSGPRPRLPRRGRAPPPPRTRATRAPRPTSATALNGLGAGTLARTSRRRDTASLDAGSPEAAYHLRWRTSRAARRALERTRPCSGSSAPRRRERGGHGRTREGLAGGGRRKQPPAGSPSETEATPTATEPPWSGTAAPPRSATPSPPRRWGRRASPASGRSCARTSTRRAVARPRRSSDGGGEGRRGRRDGRDAGEEGGGARRARPTLGGVRGEARAPSEGERRGGVRGEGKGPARKKERRRRPAVGPPPMMSADEAPVPGPRRWTRLRARGGRAGARRGVEERWDAFEAGTRARSPRARRRRSSGARRRPSRGSRNRIPKPKRLEPKGDGRPTEKEKAAERVLSAAGPFVGEGDPDPCDPTDPSAPRESNRTASAKAAAASRDPTTSRRLRRRGTAQAADGEGRERTGRRREARRSRLE